MIKEYTIHMSNEEYGWLRIANMQGKLAGSTFHRVMTSGDVVFKTHDVKKLASQLEKILDFGGTTAFEVLIGSMTRGKKELV